MPSPPKQYRILSEWPHALLWTSVIAAAMLIVGFGVLSPVLVWTALASIGIVLAGAFVLYGFSFFAVNHFKRGKDPKTWALLRAGRLGVALIPLFWLVLLVVSIPWSAPALLGLACSLPLGLMLLQWMGQPLLDKAIVSEGLGIWEAKCLLWLGADASEGLAAAVENRRNDLIPLFFHHQADLNQRDMVGKSLVMRAVLRRFSDVLKVLLSLGANARLADNLGTSPLDHAIDTGTISDIEALVAHGAYPNLTHHDKDMFFKSAYARCLYKNRVQMNLGNSQPVQRPTLELIELACEAEELSANNSRMISLLRGPTGSVH